VSRFTLIRKLSQGGLGSIWLARDEKLKRTVAIKEMNVDASESTEAWQRFHREAEITGHLEHPNIVPLYQFGSDPKTGQPFYAMRFVGKHTLADAIVEHHQRRQSGDDDVLEPHRLLTAFVGVCQAIAYALPSRSLPLIRIAQYGFMTHIRTALSRSPLVERLRT
jgi:serine/threonine protein kinase